jgi:hypothetical protein
MSKMSVLKRKILKSKNFEDFQINAVQRTVFIRYKKIISKFRASWLLHTIYFLDADKTIEYLDSIYGKDKKK